MSAIDRLSLSLSSVALKASVQAGFLQAATTVLSTATSLAGGGYK
ncbi:MAG: hypothetical protein AB7G04_11780 [Hyphomonadaceae bacterium]